MKQAVSTTKGVQVIEVPTPTARTEQALVRVHYSCVSPGSEMAAARGHQESFLRKVRARPEKALAVWRLLRTHGLGAVKERIAQQKDEPRALGYSAAGVVVDPGATGVQAGTRVAAAGTGVAVHAEWIAVPTNLLCEVPEGVSLAAASSVALGAVALQGLRRAALEVGERVVVIGLGAVGQLTARLAALAGCEVWVSDLHGARLDLAVGAHSRIRALPPTATCDSLAPDVGGADAVIITASSSAPGLLELAAALCRTRGRIVIVGDVPVQVPRELLYARELDVRLSCSYGPGRYDPTYEIEGVDYPPAYVRWTAQRNMRAYLHAIASAPEVWEGLWPEPTPIDEAPALFRDLAAGTRIFAVLGYGANDGAPLNAESRTVRRAARASSDRLRVALVGAGEFARLTLLPTLAGMSDVVLDGVATRTTLTGERLRRQYGLRLLSTDAEAVITDPDVDAVVIAVRHHEHADLALCALDAGKHVYLEKPLALTEAQVAAIANVLRTARGVLMVGYNRRFAPAVAALCDKLPGIRAVGYRFAAGVLPLKHWTLGPEGGGRLIGEACHGIDLLDMLVGPIRRAHVEPVRREASRRGEHAEEAVFTLSGDRGSATFSYLAAPSPQGGKERLEVFGERGTALVDDFRVLVTPNGRRSWSRPDKGHRAALAAFVAAARTGGPPPIPYDALLRSTRLAIAAQAAADRDAALDWQDAI